ncbi:hypothetical protein U3516DRAFT_816254 [Neocallimastix sp. 'constans']|jgi:hypothetical protein
MVERANELGRKAKENIEKGNIQEAANLYSDAAEIYQNIYKQTNNEVAKKTIQQLFIKSNKEANRISRQIKGKQNKDNLIHQQNHSNSNTLMTNNIGNNNSKSNNNDTSAQSLNKINTPNTPKNLQNFRFTNTTNNNNNNNTIENNIKSKPNYNNHESTAVPVTSLSTIFESTSSHCIDKSSFVLKENQDDEAEKAFIKFWDDIDSLVQNKVSLPVALLSAPLNNKDAVTNKVEKEKTSTFSKVSIASPSVNKNNSIESIGNKNNEEKNSSKHNNNDNDNKKDFEINDDNNLPESEYIIIPQKALPTKTNEEYQKENEKLKETIDCITSEYILLPNTEEFKLALRKAKEYVKYNEYIRSNVAAGSENELSELKKRVAYLEENNYVKQIMKLEEENKDLKIKIENLMKYKNKWDKFVAIAEEKKKKRGNVHHSDTNNKNSQTVVVNTQKVTFNDKISSIR